MSMWKMVLVGALVGAGQVKAAPKNFIIILADDQGYEDLGCFGSTRIKTPNIDRLADEGMKLTSFYTASSVCSPSRAGLLTGRMPKRVGVPSVLFPFSQTGLPPEEITLAELLQTKGYATAIVGKWHLGHKKEFLPTHQGFDSFFGLPYSNDMSISKDLALSKNIKLNQGWTLDKVQADVAQYQTDYRSMKNTMPLMRGEEIVEYPVDQSQLTRRYTEEAVRFIHENKDQPFFLYLPHSMPHWPIFVSKPFENHSGNGLYSDCIEEIDWSVGEIRKALEATGNADDTFILYCSDNGPANRALKPDSSSAGPLRGVKFDTFEGGHRVPAVLWAPGTIQAGAESDVITSTLDILPTIAHYTGIPLPADRVTDGYDLADLLAGASSVSPRNEMYYYAANSTKMDGVRVGDWKFLYEGSSFAPVVNPGDKPQKRQGNVAPMLFNVKADMGEQTNLYSAHPEKVAELKKQMNLFDKGIE